MALLDTTTDSSAAPDAGERFARQLIAYFASSRAGQAILDALSDDDVTEVYLNPDGKVWTDTYSAGTVFTGLELEPARATMFLKAVATHHHVSITRENPSVAAELPLEHFNRARLQGEIPPLVEGPSFNLRKPPPRTFSLEEMGVTGGRLSVLREGIRNRWNIVVCGWMDSGKTTFARALLLEVARLCPRDRVLILEDTPELRCDSLDVVNLRKPDHWDLTALCTIALRKKAKRICVSEVRDREALPLLDLWTTHRGGIATTHADTVENCMDRLDRLAMRNGVPSDPVLVAQAVQLVVLMEGDNAGRRVGDLVRVVRSDDKARPYLLRSYGEDGVLR
ncbi:MAG TPA: ATPase, T2SS/T4P/T4SS family [Longimicrobium sp.]